MSSIHALNPAVHPLTADDRADWLGLWGAYVDFYEASVTDDVTSHTFGRLVAGTEMHGAIARDTEGSAVGFVHWLSHPATWSRGPYVYLEDLYVAPDVRGGGIGRALIAHVEDWARANDAAKVYWLTEETNATARGLYDRVATRTGFIQYSIPLG